MQRLHASARSALCFSGGGIRSATFGLGVLQGLAAYSRKPDGERPDLLGEFDYLSTVSGGGYLGSWFSAWATRRSKIDDSGGSGERLYDCGIPDLRDGSADVIRDLASVPDVGFEPEREPVKHLRAYSNYLSPKLGFFSTDTWTLASTVLRNMFLNWLVLLPAFAAFLLIPVFCWRVMWLRPSDVEPLALWSLLIAGMLLGGQATAYVGFDLPSAGDAERSSKHFFIYCLAPLSLAAAALSVFWAWMPAGVTTAAWWDVVSLGKEGVAWWHFAVFGAVMHGGGMLVGLGHVKFRFRRPPTRTGVVATSAAFVAGFVGGLAAWTIAQLAAVETDYSDFLQDPRLYACLAFPMLMGVFLFSGSLLVGSTSYVTKDEDREWWATSGGWFLAIALGWLAFACVVLYSPQALNWLDTRTSAAVTALTSLMGFTAARVGNSSKTLSGRQDVSNADLGGTASRLFKRYGGQLLMACFMLLLVMLLSGLNQRILTVFGLPSSGPSLWGFTAPVLGLALGYSALCLMASWFINVNKFSLHAMYRQRLIRAYLGASNPFRRPHPFTGFDENDNISMCTLTANKPMHVVNMALNLVHGENLKWQERKAASFTSTRLHTGGLCIDYRPSALYGGRYTTTKTPISLGTAITISGAAASPNMGYHSSPLLMLVMTLFNARLGWWLGNPRRNRRIWTAPSPVWGIRPFLDEAFGLTTDTNSWIYLSDGGHFENLAIYEMVLRRCHCIVVSDAGCDPDYTYEDLANAVRKIRIDLGIPIDFDDPHMPMSADKMPTARHSGKHCAIARIRYSAVDGPDAPEGILIYIKPSLNGNEPADVQHYAAADPLFPHQPTSDQFFDESQFESYRRLGLHVIEEMLRSPDGKAYEFTLSEFVTAAGEYASKNQP
ncbi:MAG: patatin-like phospholipase family protein [Acidobacteriia bacterium]|nr:patatin-like phospholipase family protein [Terriglobia bacterium]